MASGVTRLRLMSVTIVLPTAGFAPLYALARVGGLSALQAARAQSPDWASLHDQSLDGLWAFNVSR